MRRVPLTPFSTLTRKGFMYNSYILALTCVMSDLDSSAYYFAYVSRCGWNLPNFFLFFCHRRLPRNIFTLSLYLLLPVGHSNNASTETYKTEDIIQSRSDCGHDVPIWGVISPPWRHPEVTIRSGADGVLFFFSEKI